MVEEHLILADYETVSAYWLQSTERVWTVDYVLLHTEVLTDGTPLDTVADAPLTARVVGPTRWRDVLHRSTVGRKRALGLGQGISSRARNRERGMDGRDGRDKHPGIDAVSAMVVAIATASSTTATFPLDGDGQ